MSATKDERIKQAYAYGSSIALQEVGFDQKTAEETGVELTKEASAVPAPSTRVKQAYAFGAARALAESGYDRETAVALAAELA